jgi:hypothetical protein
MHPPKGNERKHTEHGNQSINSHDAIKVNQCARLIFVPVSPSIGSAVFCAEHVRNQTAILHFVTNESQKYESRIPLFIAIARVLHIRVERKCLYWRRLFYFIFGAVCCLFLSEKRHIDLYFTSPYIFGL